MTKMPTWVQILIFSTLRIVRIDKSPSNIDNLINHTYNMGDIDLEQSKRVHFNIEF